ncbi:unnamed protein product [Trifolium pratense]|uniref:Uncharacterized protein n=1 Tax=Trifolium pratense TaxID=57577 RepID=A0ACB0IEJ8_TRIPR|nr:unnamed protein product [Trifolium pratense]
MVKILMFFQIMFTFIFIFTVVIEGFPKYNHYQKCYNDKDCPVFLCIPPRVPKCIRKSCRCVDN